MTTKTTAVCQLNEGIEMPVLGLGVFLSEPEKTVAAVVAALEVGYRLLDTAAAYRNEHQVGEGIRASGVPREQIFVTTKLWINDYGHETTFTAFDRSLGQLGLDYLDLYLLHWPVPSTFETTLASYQAALELKESGRVRAIGVCNFTPAHLERLIAQTGHTPAVNQVELHPFFTQRVLREVDARHGIITQAWSPIGGVQRYGAKSKESGQVNDPLSHPTVTALAQKYGKTPAQVILRWQIELGNSPIPKSIRPPRIAENFAVFDFSLTPAEVQSIEALDTGVRGGWDPDEVDATTFEAAR